MPENERPDIPQVKDKRFKIPGLLPKNAQARVLGGIALLMVIIISLSGKNPPKPPASVQTPQAAPVDPNQARIQEYRARIEEQTRRLAAEEAQLARTKEALGAPAPTQPLGGGTASAATSYNGPAVSYGPGYAQPASPSPVQAEREKREYEAPFASNIALSYRSPAPLQPSTPLKAPSGNDANHGALDPKVEPLAAARGKKYELFEGTVIETVLTNRLEASLAGPVNCMVATNVYSHDRQHVLIPQGTRILGEVRKVETFGEQRVAVMFHRLIMPDGFSVNLDKFQGLSQQGETGLLDQVNHHYLQIFGVSIAIGAIAGLSQANTRYGLDASGMDAYRQGVASSLSQSSLHILDRYLNVLPTYTIREGHRIKVYLAQDLLLPAYDQHEMPEDI
jgi:type IV secretory pathway VirB10-like protein